MSELINKKSENYLHESIIANIISTFQIKEHNSLNLVIKKLAEAQNQIKNLKFKEIVFIDILYNEVEKYFEKIKSTDETDKVINANGHNLVITFLGEGADADNIEINIEIKSITNVLITVSEKQNNKNTFTINDNTQTYFDMYTLKLTNEFEIITKQAIKCFFNLIITHLPKMLYGKKYFNIIYKINKNEGLVPADPILNKKPNVYLVNKLQELFNFTKIGQNEQNEQYEQTGQITFGVPVLCKSQGGSVKKNKKTVKPKPVKPKPVKPKSIKPKPVKPKPVKPKVVKPKPVKPKPTKPKK
jgi:hypothetical protein